MTDEYLDHQTSQINHDTALEAQELNLFSMLKPSIQQDGNQWCVLYGKDLHDGIAGFGDTPHKAVLDFNKEWNKSAKKQEIQHTPGCVNTYDDPLQWGRNSFVSGVKRSDCPIDRRTHANSLCLWLKGWDEESANKSEKKPDTTPEIFPGTRDALSSL